MLSSEWINCAESIIGGRELKSFQLDAISAIIETRRNLIIDGAPSTGKTVVGFISLFKEIKKGSRGVLLEPLRILVDEKFEILEKNKDVIENVIGSFELVRKMGGSHLSFSTGTKEILITTPEYYMTMNDGIVPGVICVDEAQMINSPRGRSLIKIINRSQINGENSRVVLMGHNLDPAWETWLSPSTLIKGQNKNESSIVWLGDSSKFENIVALLEKIFSIDSDSQVLIFVSQVRFSNSLVKRLGSILNKQITGVMGPLAFNGKLDRKKRESIKKAVEDKECNIVVATTALLQGVDFPFTHVIIRDINIPSRGPLTDEEIVQLAGRAGRRGKKGRTWVLRKKPTKGWKRRLKREEGAFITLTGFLSRRDLLWIDIEQSLLNTPWFSGDLSYLSNLIRKLISGSIIIRQKDRYTLSSYGEAIFKSFLSLDTVVYWDNFWKNTPPSQYTAFDKLLVYAAATGEGSALRKEKPQIVESKLWDIWLKDGHWDLFFSTMGKKVVNPVKSGERAMALAMKYVGGDKTEDVFYIGFSTIEKLGKKV